MDEEIRQALTEVREMKRMCGNINMKLTNIVTQRGQDIQKKLDAEYQRGLEEGKKATFGLVADASNAEYQRGLEDGKAIHEKGCEGCKYEGRELNKLPCMVCSNSRENCWTAKDDKIEVGDEVYCKGDDESDSGVVTWVGKDKICVMWQDGSAGENQKDEFLKTGRHFDIAKILEEMRK